MRQYEGRSRNKVNSRLEGATQMGGDVLERSDGNKTKPVVK
jgi:hypothetical protein